MTHLNESLKRIGVNKIMKMITRANIIPQSNRHGMSRTAERNPARSQMYRFIGCWSFKKRGSYARSTLWEMNIKYSHGVRTSVGEI